jgi:hypothetical protein
MISLAKLILEIQKVNLVVKITDKTYVELTPEMKDFLGKHCEFEFGGGSEFYEAPVIDVLNDFSQGDIEFNEDYIICPKINPNGGTIDPNTGNIIPYAGKVGDWKTWDKEEVDQFNDIVNLLGDSHYSIYGDGLMTPVFLEYKMLKKEYGIVFYESVMTEGGGIVTTFDENGNIIFNKDYLDDMAF